MGFDWKVLDGATIEEKSVGGAMLWSNLSVMFPAFGKKNGSNCRSNYDF
jgi:hypothetical protein